MEANNETKLVPGVGRMPYPAYQGDEPYIFVSYAHADSEKVFAEIIKLNKAGYHVWYDEGIAPGNEWTDEIADALAGCALFVVMITPASTASENVQNEINYAIDEKKPFIAIHLEETDLKRGIKLQIGSKQAILKYNMTEEEYDYKLVRAFANYGLKQGEGGYFEPSAKPAEPVKKRSKKPVIIAIAAIIVAAIIAVIIIVSGGKKNTDPVEPAAPDPVPSETTTTVSEIEQSMDDHILLKLANANHQYEVGLENWRRLDYNRAERDILEARNEISEETSQGEIEVAKINYSLGSLYLDMGRYSDAYDYLNSAYVTFRNQLGESSLESRAVRSSLARYYYNVGKLDEALMEIQYILDNSDEETEKSIIASTSHLRAMIYDEQGKYDDALLLYKKVLDMYDDISQDGQLSEQLANYANDSALTQTEKDNYTNAIKWIILTYNNIAKVNIHKEDYAAAIEAANTGLDLSLSNVYIGKRNITTSKLYMNLAIAQGKNDDISNALDNIDVAMRIQRNLFDFEDVFPGLVEVYDVYGELLFMNGKIFEAREYYQDAVDLAMDSFGKNHPDTADALHALGNYKRIAFETEAAVADLEEAIEIRKNILAENHPITALIYYNLAMAQIDEGNTSDAQENLQNAKEICEEWNVEGVLTDNINNALKQ